LIAPNFDNPVSAVESAIPLAEGEDQMTKIGSVMLGMNTCEGVVCEKLEEVW
jgi:hypothetical protein